MEKSSNIAVDQAGEDTGGGGCIPPSTGSASQGPQERNPPTRGAFSDKQGNVFIKVHFVETGARRRTRHWSQCVGCGQIRLIRTKKRCLRCDRCRKRVQGITAAFAGRVLPGELGLNRSAIKRVNELGEVRGSFYPLEWSCSRCGVTRKNPSFFDIDHKVALSKGGPDTPENKEILCPNCHREKTLRCEDNKATVESQQEEDAAQGGASMDASRRDAPDSQAHRGIDKGDWTPNVKP